ncbi:type III pantothenate kinase [Bdellovibrio svalbardensis]|uniref:Type III pantothenate kinase n=1 Tax=Bdellovibrio svalbardensis TaxID=2972972 RepID=A0ABT6DEH1_9BACT|nr:type III pantothenate kinase [Bdellovibrio svalbardensis]MDG0815228.1 type III pantothenate kinase [Bdellovibrio svalbardensis]
MILCLDVGNTQIFGGLFDKDKMVLSFRKNSKSGASSDETGIFLRTAIRENGYDPTKIRQIAICSVVPEVIYSLRGACMKYFNINPFILQAGVKTGLKVKYRNPLEVGADRIANSIAATHLYPNQNVVIVDLGTATTFCALTKEKDYLGGSIVAGLRLCMEALESKTAKLPSVEIVAMHEALGRSTIESIQSGLYYSHVGAMKEIIERMTKECFHGEKPFVIGTGGFSSLFEKEKVFDVIIPDLVLKGMLIALQLNN